MVEISHTTKKTLSQKTKKSKKEKVKQTNKNILTKQTKQFTMLLHTPNKEEEQWKELKLE